MNRLLTFTLLLLLFQVLTAQTKKAIIKGTITGLNGRELVLLNTDKTELARISASNDQFSIEADIVQDDGRKYGLYVPELGKLGPSMNNPVIYFFIDSHRIEINAKIENGNLQLEQIKGSPSNDEYDLLYKENKESANVNLLTSEYNKIFHKYNDDEPTEENLQKLLSISKTVDSLMICEKNEFINMIPQHRKSKVLASIVMPYLFFEDSPEKIQAAVNSFDKSIHSCYPLMVLQSKIDKIKSMEIGKIAPDFNLADSNGNMVTLSSMRGKYVLIDFWASWCGPCIKELPNIKKVYAEFKDKGLEVIGISIDSDEKAWRHALQKEKLPYLQLHDPKSYTPKLYNFAGIPFIILISPEGILLEKELWGEKLRSKIEEYIL